MIEVNLTRSDNDFVELVFKSGLRPLVIKMCLAELADLAGYLGYMTDPSTTLQTGETYATYLQWDNQHVERGWDDEYKFPDVQIVPPSAEVAKRGSLDDAEWVKVK